MAETLNASTWTRLTARLRPDWTRTVLARRLVAAALVVLAAVAAIRSNPRGDRTDVVVAARDLAPGVELTAEDVTLDDFAVAAVPDGAQTDPAAIVGTTLAGPARRGEMLTDVRLLSPRLAEAAAGPDARIVPLHLTDTALLDLIRPGDVVDVLAAADSGLTERDEAPQVIASAAVVVLVSARAKGQTGADDRVVLVALPAGAANTVAGTALVAAITLTFH